MPLFLQKRIAILTLMLMSASVLSAEKPVQELPKWEFGLGPSVYHYPDYPGSKETNNLFLPFPYIKYRGDKVTVDRGEIKSGLFESDKLELNISLSGSIPVNSEDNKKRQGMYDLDASLEVGPVLRYEILRHGLSDLKLELPIRKVLATDFKSIREEGWVASPALRYNYRKGISYTQSLKLSFQAQAQFATEKFHDYFYQVDQKYATPNRPEYDAKGGFSGMKYSIGMGWRINQIWVGGFYRIMDLSNANYIDSPLIETKQANTFALGFTWIFYESEQKVRGLE